MLERIWDTLMPEKARDGRFTKQWIDIGFQGADPVTDLRGSGLLGLTQLYSFIVRNKTEAQPLFECSVNQSTWYFFCACGINIT